MVLRQHLLVEGLHVLHLCLMVFIAELRHYRFIGILTTYLRAYIAFLRNILHTLLTLLCKCLYLCRLIGVGGDVGSVGCYGFGRTRY